MTIVQPNPRAAITGRKQWEKSKAPCDVSTRHQSCDVIVCVNTFSSFFYGTVAGYAMIHFT